MRAVGLEILNLSSILVCLLRGESVILGQLFERG